LYGDQVPQESGSAKGSTDVLECTARISAKA
jgi:hypothetical protein